MKSKLLMTTAIISISFAVSSNADIRYEVKAGETVDIPAGIYENNNETGNGGIASITQGTLNIADGAELKNSKAKFGGAVFNKSGTIETGKVLFEGNEATSSGGAIYNYQTGAKTTIGNDSSFNKNKAAQTGGAIFNGTTTNIGSNVIFSDNKAGTWGGAIYNNTDGKVDIKNNVVFSGNEAGQYGGAIFNRGEIIVTDKALFAKNTAENYGGAIYNYTNGTTNGTVEIGSNVVFSGNEAKQFGGAIFNISSIKISSNAVFTGNKSQNNAGDKVEGVGGAIYSQDGSLEIGEGALFEGNESGYSGGALHITGENHADVTINQATFKDNKSGNGGAIALGINDANKTFTIKNSMFEHNAAANNGGAFVQLQTLGNGAKIEIDNTTFLNNEAEYEGGALTSDSVMNITNSTFTGNKTLNEVDDPRIAGGGAIVMWDQGKVTIKNSAFNNNTTAGKGGVIGTRPKDKDAENKGSFLYIEDSTFDGNKAELNGGVISTYVPTTIVNSSFTNNTSGGKGGALTVGNDTTLTIKGDNNFTGNNDSTGANDISNNKGRVEVSGNLTLDGGISGAGTTVFEEGSVLTVTTGKTKITNDVINNGASVNLIINTGFEGEYQLVEGTLNKEFYDYDKNKIYKVDSIKNGSYNVSKKSTEEVAEALETTDSTAEKLLAVISGGDSNKEFADIADRLNVAAQEGNSGFVEDALANLGADHNPIVRIRETDLNNMLFAAINDELNDADGALAEGLSSGDSLKQTKVWIRTMANRLDKEKTSKASGFDADTYGVAFGLQAELENNITAGFGYAYAKTDVSGHRRDTDVQSNTAFVYGKYQPANWYLNAAIAYTWSDYDEKKSVLGYNADGKYEVKTLASEAMYGYEAKLNSYELTPEAGLRYMHIDQGSYTDNLGTHVQSRDMDVLTAVAGAKVGKTYTTEKGVVIRPEISAAVTYDLTDDNNNLAVTLANGAGYISHGESLERLGFEAGLKAAVDVSENAKISAGYQTRLRKDYQDHTFMLEARYDL